VAVSLKRFLTPLFVLSLGILVSLVTTHQTRRGSPYSQAGYRIRVD
jgi:hypothetical protein